MRRQIRHLTVLIENRADTMSAHMTGNSLALASALTKVGRHLVAPSSAQVLSLTGNDNPSLLRQRVAFLLEEPEPARERYPGLSLLFASFLIDYAYRSPPCAGLQCNIETMTHPRQSESQGSGEPGIVH
ncbi:MAG: hypothetical protein ACRER2_16495 [Methylococcales bacterium]